MGDLKPGAILFDEQGKTCRVTWVSDIETPPSAYALRFRDGASILACADHQWVTWTYAERKALLRSPYEDKHVFPRDWPRWKLRRICGTQPSESRIRPALALIASGLSIRKAAVRAGICRSSLKVHLAAAKYVRRTPIIYEDSPGPRVRTTSEIAATLLQPTARADLNHCIPNCLPLDLPRVRLPIPPYTLGAWLGDGGSHGAAITQHEPDQASLIKNIERDGFECRMHSHPQNFGILGLQILLRTTGLLRNKHIPPLYLRASIPQRLALLQGLMDTDGGIERASTASFSNTNLNLADGVYELVCSLGMKATREQRKTSGNYDSHRVTFTPTMQVFRLPRKADRISFSCSQQMRRRHRMIEAAEPIELPGPMRCITVDSPNSMYLAGRAMIPTHNTRVGAETVREWARDPSERILMIAPTASDVRDVMIEGPSGLMSCYPPGQRPVYYPTRHLVQFPSGAVGITRSADVPERLRGPQFRKFWFDELCATEQPQEAWDQVQFGFRVPGPHLRGIITTTPKPLKILKAILANPRTVVTRGSSDENRANLSADFIADVIDPYRGTRLGRQEIEAELLEDIPGALWTRKLLDATRIKEADINWHRIVRTIIAIDPAVTHLESSDLTGIIMAMLTESRHVIIFRDLSCRESALGWAKIAIAAYRTRRLDKIVAEVNNGGDLVEANLRTIEPNVSYGKVWASRGKHIRAEPVASLYEQGRVHHVEGLGDLEDELCSWTPQSNDPSPNRLDAMVWAVTELLVQNEEITLQRQFAEPYRIGI
ncbi:MAG: hypothetical protein EPO00_13360 [Chloroflexota bacterium]|nr:MAG: hypothetical protein EPO00_13360 [Chloroflexota bacterium]